MFGLFGKKEKPVPVTDLVWMTDTGKKKGLLNILQKDMTVVLVAWFEDTAREMETFLQQEGIEYSILSQRQLRSSQTTGREVVFLEHYPLYKKEQETFKSLNAAKITVLSSLEEPLLKQFGGERISLLMRNMGGMEEEAISHNMVTLSIQRAQQKLEKKITVDQSGISAAEWFRRNVG
ncbi:MAG TPA: hypothetical protein P5158_04985 [Chitinophagaceae bacterium]|nr:hypothetical protein [Chitinophagaceae bacterium]MCB9056433.1 hypothetical protein [Chitinophagales bacterium]HRX93446.1 hypothetical protein [Chitinophagaceae bacterium]